MSTRAKAIEDAAREARDELREHVGDGCAGPHGTPRRGACSECRIAERLDAALALPPDPAPAVSERDYAFRVAMLARAEPDLPIESVVFQASLPNRVIAAPAASAPLRTKACLGFASDWRTEQQARGASWPGLDAYLSELAARIEAPPPTDLAAVVARLRARATSEQVCAERAAIEGHHDAYKRVVGYTRAADVLREEADSLERDAPKAAPDLLAAERAAHEVTRSQRDVALARIAAYPKNVARLEDECARLDAQLIVARVGRNEAVEQRDAALSRVREVAERVAREVSAAAEEAAEGLSGGTLAAILDRHCPETAEQRELRAAREAVIEAAAAIIDRDDRARSGAELRVREGELLRSALRAHLSRLRAAEAAAKAGGR